MSMPIPRDKKTKRNFPYIYNIDKDVCHNTNWKLNEPFISEWLEISVDGEIKIKASEDNKYSWDGCTPKFSIFNLFILGTPDGHIDYRTGKPFTYKASLIHDALYQYIDSVPISKKEIDLLFKEILGDFKLAYLYYMAVKYFGAWGVIQHGLKNKVT